MCVWGEGELSRLLIRVGRLESFRVDWVRLGRGRFAIAEMRSDGSGSA